MNISVIESQFLNEKIYHVQYESGLKAYCLPKPGFSKQYAMFATNYGSIDNKFKTPGDEKHTEVPNGIAHFLEHKLFEQEDGSIFDKFSMLGSNPNAYTNYNQTAYLFSCTDKFYENFELLLHFVQNPYLTDQNVQKEKGIIEQEIKMYDDDPESKVFNNLMSCLYINNPIKEDIAGTVQSIQEIDKNILMKCYNAFYNPSNMVVFVIGDISYDKVFESIEKSVKKPFAPKIQREKIDEPQNINNNYIEAKLSVSIPTFNIGFKDSAVGVKGKELSKKILCSNIILDIIFGKSSDFFNKLYAQGLINDNFKAQFIGEERYCFAIIEGESKEPNLVKEKMVEEINKFLQKGIKREDFERIKKMKIGRFTREFDDIESVAQTFISYIFDDIIIFEHLDILYNLSYDDVLVRLKELFDINKMAVSVVNPI